jgi:phage FluMu protein gp41
MYSKLIYLFTVMAIFFSLGTAAPAAYADHETTVSGLRAVLAAQLGEHVLLASSATGAALAGRQPQFEGAAAALDANSVDVSKTIGLVYGPEAEAAFLDLWRKHINLVVDYTTGLATKDQAKADQAVNALLAYTGEFGAFLNNANPNLPKEDVAKLVEMHILTLKDVIDAQAAGDQTMVYTKLREAYAHMDMIAMPIAAAVGQQFPDRWVGEVDAPGASLRTTLNLQLREHLYLAAIATGAALGGRQPQFEAAAAALDANSVDFSKSIGLVYGPEAEGQFLPLWRKHIGFVVDYTTALAAKDQAKADQAVNALLAYTGEIGTFLSNANPNLPQDTVADLVQMHILTLKDVIDAQAAGDQMMVYSKLREAYGHMGMIANPIAAAISQQFPDKFGGVVAPAAPAASAPAAAPLTLPQTGGEVSMLEPAYLLTIIAVMVIAGGAWLMMRARRSA